jgi:heat shock protein HslJ
MRRSLNIAERGAHRENRMMSRELWNGLVTMTCAVFVSVIATADAMAQADAPLGDTTWRLVKFQSMDDAIGTVRPDDPALYTMRLNADGSVTMRLNCNRAMGTWTAEPGEGGDSGRFGFGPLAMTRALCPPPSMDERIAADSEYIRSYLLKDGRLYLSLMADAGIYVWEPELPEVGATDPSAAPEAAAAEKGDPGE